MPKNNQEYQPNATADQRYYKGPKGRNESVINRNGSDRRGRPGAPLKSVASPVVVVGDTSTDKYYNTGGSKMQQRRTPPPAEVPAKHTDTKARPKPGAVYKSNKPDPATHGVVRPLVVDQNKPANIRAAIQEIVDLMQGGQEVVIVQVVDAAAETAIRTGLDIRCAREEITRDQYRDVKFSLLPKTGAEIAEQAFGKVKPEQVPVASDDEPEMPKDFANFVNSGEDDDDEPEKTKPAAAGAPPGAAVPIATGEDYGDDGDDD